MRLIFLLFLLYHINYIILLTKTTAIQATIKLFLTSWSVGFLYST